MQLPCVETIGSNSITFAVVLLVGGVILLLILTNLIIFHLGRSRFKSKIQSILSREDVDSYIEREDELGQLSREIHRLEQNLDALLKISEATRGDIPLDNIYQHILDIVIDAVGYSYGGISLVEPNGEFVYNVAKKFTPEYLHRYVEIESFSKEFMRPLKYMQEPYYIYDVLADPQGIPEVLLEKYRALLKVPLLSGKKLIGVLTIAKEEPYAWSSEELRWMASVGRQLGILVDHIRFSERVQEVAILTERERISQELHDNFSQYIGTIRLLADNIVETCGQGDYGDLINDVKHIETIANDAYASLRDEMYGLRIIKTSEQTLLATVREHLDRFRRQWGIETSLETNNIKEPYFISEIVTIQFLRILQEALVNISRHAQATRVTVTFNDENDRLQVDIIDNGVGFDPDADFENQFGVKIMHERAAVLGGSVTIDTALHAGTIVRVNLPKIVAKPYLPGEF